MHLSPRTMYQALPPNEAKGFSLVEMMVSLSIIIIISGILLVGFPSFSSSLVLNNLAHEVALTVREAQAFGIGTREFGGQFPSHGVYFDTTTAERRKEVVLFADLAEGGDEEGDGLYDAGELVNRFAIRGNNEISELRAEGIEVDQLDITYTRPNPEATILGTREGTTREYSSAEIDLQTLGEDPETRTVRVHTNGQIAVE